MPIELTISHDERLVIALVGEVGPADFGRYFAELEAAGALAYRKIIDLTSSPLAVSGGDIRALGDRVNAYAQGGALGAMAVVINTELASVMTEVYEKRVRADRPLRVCRDLAEARQWLDQVDPPAGG
jgi:hypothetical protein